MIANKLEIEIEGRKSRLGRASDVAKRPQVAFGLVIGIFWLIVLCSVSIWAPYDPLEAVSPRLLAPSMSHLLGTDALGRDVLTRVLYGARESMPIAAAVIICATVIGTLLGAVAGYVGGWVDAVVMRITDVVMAFPAILLAMAISAALGPGLRNGFIAILIVWWPIYARLVRGQVLSIKQREHVEAAISIGATRRRILQKHVMPMAITPVLVNATMDFGQVVLFLASLSFLGLGALPPSPEWGSMITEGAKNFYQWWIAVGPGLAILTVVLGFNFLGDGLRDVLDPRSKGEK
jgi:peptide/nickel transport system permease protein